MPFRGKRRILTSNELIILGQIQKAIKGDTSAARLVFDMRLKLTDEHVELHPGLAEMLEYGERRFTEDDSERLNKHSLEVFNQVRRRTMKV